MEKLASVVVLYEPSIEILKNISSYLEDVEKLYVVDNSKINNENLIQINTKIEYIWNEKNLGIAKALNLACEKAIKDGFNWILTLDQDSKFEDHIVFEIKKQLNNVMNNIGIVTPWHCTKLMVEKSTNEVDYPDDIMTSGNFLNLKIYKKLGGFKNDFFIDGVDIEYCLRLKKNNYSIMRLNKYELKHDLGHIVIHRFLGRNYICTNHNYLRNYYMARNYRYIKKEYGEISPNFCNTLIKYKGIMFKIIMFEKDKYRKIRNIFRGIFDFHRNIKGEYRFKN
ncbi:MAG: glycosyltransferase [Bacilli bacterium]